MEQTKRLYRSRYDTVIAGVAGGLAKYFNIDPIIVRILFVALVLAGASGILIYIILWIALPIDPDLNFYRYSKHTAYPFGSDYQEKAPNADEPAGESEPDTGNPSENSNSEPTVAKVRKNTRNEGNLIAGITLIVLGGIFLIVRLIPHLSISHLWPLILVAAGILVLINALSKPKTY